MKHLRPLAIRTVAVASLAVALLLLELRNTATSGAPVQKPVAS